MAKFTQDQLAQRWHMSPWTLEQWRWLGRGPRFLKIGARVSYDESVMEDFEAGQTCQNTHGPIGQEGE
ncbi:MAG: DNA-binding protein [Pseudomonadota bacterium]